MTKRRSGARLEAAGTTIFGPHRCFTTVFGQVRPFYRATKVTTTGASVIRKKNIEISTLKWFENIKTEIFIKWTFMIRGPKPIQLLFSTFLKPLSHIPNMGLNFCIIFLTDW